MFGRTPRPYLNADLLEAIGARYVVTADAADRRGRRGSTGRSTSIFEAHRLLAGRVREHAGARQERRAGAVERHRRRPHVEVPADRINLEFVLGNKVMVGTVNANREYFETGVRDMAHGRGGVSGLAAAAADAPGAGPGATTASCSTRSQNPNGAIKIFCEVSRRRDLPRVRGLHRRLSRRASCPPTDRSAFEHHLHALPELPRSISAGYAADRRAREARVRQRRGGGARRGARGTGQGDPRARKPAADRNLAGRSVIQAGMMFTPHGAHP